MYFWITQYMFMDHLLEINEKRSQFNQMVTGSAKTVLGPKTWVHQDWFDESNEEINKLLKVECLYRMAEWYDITIKERTLQIPEEQSSDITLKNTG